MFRVLRSVLNLRINKGVVRSVTSSALISREAKVVAQNYHPLPVVLSKGQGVFVWDVEGKRYYDFLSAYSALNQGHNHPHIVEVMKNQLDELALTSRAFHNDVLFEYAEYMTNIFGYDRLLPMNSGAEAVETAVKVAKKWAYNSKKVPENEAKIIVCENNFHGRTAFPISASTDPDAFKDYGPFLPGIIKIPYNDVKSLNAALQDPTCAALLIEPIQGEAGVYIPDDGYLKTCRELCSRYNVLFVVDEIQTGCGRTGKMLAIDHEEIRADVLILGKALSGGMYPISAVLADDSIMLHIKPGQHGSTFGGNPLACKIAMASLDVLFKEDLICRADKLGKLLMDGLRTLPKSIVKLVRGKGLLTAIVIDSKYNAFDVCVRMKDNGLLAKQTHGDIIRFAPPLVITEEQVKECLEIIRKTLVSFE